MTKIVLFRAALVALAAGTALLGVAHGTLATALGVGLVAIACAALAAVAFWMVGDSEDRHRLRHPRG